MRLNYFYSDAQKKTIDGLAAAEEEYQKPAKEIWGTRFVFRGSHPVLSCPDPSCTYATVSGCTFDRSCIVSFELPEEPYANPPLQSSKSVIFGNGTTVEFDLTKVGDAGGKYVLADMSAGGTLTVSDTQLASMQASLQEAAAAAGRHAKIYRDGAKLVVKVGSTFGLMLIFR